MKIAALILGIIGGLAGIFGSVTVLFLGGVGGAFGAEGAEQVIGLGFAALPLALIGIIGGAIAMAKPKAAGIMMLISGVGGIIAISAGYAIAGPLLIIGGIMGLVASKKESAPVTQNQNSSI